MASSIWYWEPELSSFAIRGTEKKPQILEWFEKEAQFGAKHPRKSMQTLPVPAAMPSRHSHLPEPLGMSSQGCEKFPFMVGVFWEV